MELPAEQTPVESPHPSPSILASQNEPTDQDRAVFEEQEQNQEEQEEEEEEEEPEFRRPMRTPRKPLKPRRVLKPRQRKQSNPSKFVVRKASGSVEENDTLEEISLPSSKDSTHEVSDDDDVEEELKEPSPSGSKTSGPRRMKRSAALANSDCGEKTPPKEVVEPEENTATEAAGSDSSSSYDLSENEGGNRNQEEDGDYSQTGLFEDSRISTTGCKYFLFSSKNGFESLKI